MPLKNSVSRRRSGTPYEHTDSCAVNAMFEGGHNVRVQFRPQRIWGGGVRAYSVVETLKTSIDQTIKTLMMSNSRIKDIEQQFW